MDLQTIYAFIIAVVALLSLLWATVFLVKIKQRKNLKNGFFTATPTLDFFSRDLTMLARKGKLDAIIGREKEMDNLAIILSRRTKNNAVLVGNVGIGKTTIVEGLAKKISEGKASLGLAGKRIIALDVNALLAGTKYRGEYEKRVKAVIDEIARSERKIILFIDEIQDILEAETSGESISIADVFKPAMARGELQIIGATTREDYEKYFNRDQAFKRRIQPIFVTEPDKEETIRILEGIKEKYEKFHNVKISQEVVVECVEQAQKIMPERYFPDKAIDLMDEVASAVKIESAGSGNSDKSEGKKIIVADVSRIVEQYIGN